MGWITEFYGHYPVWTAVGTVVVAILAILLTVDFFVTWKLQHLPGPFHIPIIGHIPFLLKEPWRVFYEFSRRYGPVYLIRLWFKPMVIVSDPELVKQMFRDRSEIYIKDQWSYDYFRDVLGWGLVTSEGKVWEDHRRMMMPAFDFKALERLQKIFEEATARLLVSTRAACKSAIKTTIDDKEFKRSNVTVGSTGDGRGIMELSSTFRQVTQEVISEVALGMKPDDASQFPLLFEAVLDELNERPFQPWRAFIPSIEGPHRKNVNRLNAIVQTVIDARRAIRRATNAVPTQKVNALSDKSSLDSLELTGEGAGVSLSGKVIFENGCDMLDMMLDSGIELSDLQLSDEVKTQLLAGHETSSMMLTWATYLLARYPEAMQKAVDEVDRVLGLAPGITETRVPDAQTTEHPSFKGFRSLTYLEWALKEAMRLFTPVPVLNRELTQDDVLGDYKIPAHSTIVVSIWSMHMNPKIWGDDVYEFRPERFSADECKTRHNWSYMPFSLGARSCIGQNLAFTEAKTVLGSLLREYTISLPPDHEEPVTDRYVMPLRPEKRLNVVLTPRK